MAKGAKAKEEIKTKLFDCFPGTFMNGKEIRIPWVEDGETVEIKVALTCAKDNVGGGASSYTMISNADSTNAASATVSTEITEEEKKNVNDLAGLLGLI